MRESADQGAGMARGVAAGLAMAACAAAGWACLACAKADIEASETPLLLAAARQLAAPRELYGPYTSGHHLVLIHPPLYYRLTALAAWPLAAFLRDPIQAALIAGRSISTLALLLTLAAIYRLATLAPNAACTGLIASLLFCAAPIQGGVFFEVRPDMLGTACTLWGASLALAPAFRESFHTPSVLGGFGLLGLAVTIKQQHVLAPPLLALIIAASRPGWRPAGRIALTGLAASLTLSAAILLLEQWFTRGNLWQSVVVAAQAVSRLRPGNTWAMISMTSALLWKNAGPILIAAAVFRASSPPTESRVRITNGLTGLLIALAALLIGFQAWTPRLAWAAILTGLVTTLLLATLLRGLGRLEPRRSPGRALERACALLCTGELALFATLARLSSGAWYNYALTAEAYACVLAGRFLARELAQVRTQHRGTWAVATALLATAIFAFTDLRESTHHRAREQAETQTLRSLAARLNAPIVFLDRPGENRLSGRPDLVYDPWLYPVFETLRLAQPRSTWLKNTLESTPQSLIAVTPETRLSDLGFDLRKLGYNKISSRPGSSFQVYIRLPDRPSWRPAAPDATFVVGMADPGNLELQTSHDRDACESYRD